MQQLHLEGTACQRGSCQSVSCKANQRIVKELNTVMNRIKRWLKIYFSEYVIVYGCQNVSKTFYLLSPFFYKPHKPL